MLLLVGDLWAVQLRNYILEINNKINLALSNPVIATEVMHDISNELLSLNYNQFSNSDYAQSSDEILRLLFSAKIKLRVFLSSIDYSNGMVNKLDLEVAVRRLLNFIRYAEDYISEAAIKNEKISNKQTITFEGGSKYNQNKYGEAFSVASLQSGDVILIRGSTAISSSIARISYSPSTSSHLALVYKDEKSNQGYLLEAISDKGVIMTDLKTALSEPLSRVTVFRSVDQGLSKKAAQFAYDEYRKKEIQGERLKFDFTLDMTYNCRYFCSKFVSWVYDVASDGQVILPKYRSNLVRENNSFKNRIGVSPSTEYSFLPSDIDLDPRFELIHEFRNPQMTPFIRLDDFVTDKIFEWIDKENLDFNPSRFMRIFSNVIVMMAQYKILNLGLRKLNINLNPETSAELVSTVAIMKFTIEKIKSAIIPELAKHYNAVGSNLSPYKVYELIENYKNKNKDVLKHFRKLPLRHNSLKSCLNYY